MSFKKLEIGENFFEEKFPYFVHQLQNSVQLMMLNWEFFRKESNDLYLDEITEQINYIEILFSKLNRTSNHFKKNAEKDFFVKVELKSLLKKIYKEFLKRKTSYQFSLELPETEKFLFVDVFYMQEVIRILFENAVKYTPRGETISLKLSESEENVEISLTNTGIGVKKNLQEKIFQPFERGQNKEEGLGLGLNIAQKIIQVHRGKIIVKSDEKSYVSFIILLPKS